MALCDWEQPGTVPFCVPAMFLRHWGNNVVLISESRFKIMSAISIILLLGPVGLLDSKGDTDIRPNMSSRLLSHLSKMEAHEDTETKVPSWSEELKGVRLDSAGRLEVMIQTTEITAQVLKELEAHGCSIEIYDAAQNLVQVWISPRQIGEVASLPFIKFLDLPDYGVTNQLGGE